MFRIVEAVHPRPAIPGSPRRAGPADPHSSASFPPHRLLIGARCSHGQAALTRRLCRAQRWRSPSPRPTPRHSREVGIDRRARIRTPGRHRRTTDLPVRRGRLRTQIPRHRIALAPRVRGTVPARAHHGSQHARPASAPLPHRRHRPRFLPHATSQSERRNPTQDQLNISEGWGLSVGHQRGPQLGP